MTRILVEKWEESLAIRVPTDVARESGLAVGEKVEIDVRDGIILIRRENACAPNRRAAEEAAAAIIAESKAHSLSGTSITELRNDGRR